MMVGIIARYGTKVVVATGPNREWVEEVVIGLFLEEGIDVRGIEIDTVMFDLSEHGGIIIDTADSVSGTWTADGWQSE